MESKNEYQLGAEAMRKNAIAILMQWKQCKQLTDQSGSPLSRDEVQLMLNGIIGDLELVPWK